MPNIDFRNLEKPFEYIRKKLPDATEAEIMEAHLSICELLNMLWDIHNENLASDENCDTVKKGEANY